MGEKPEDATKKERSRVRTREQKNSSLYVDNDPGLTNDADLTELGMGIAVELEHTGDPKEAKETAADNLVKDPHYYSSLKKSIRLSEPLVFYPIGG